MAETDRAPDSAILLKTRWVPWIVAGAFCLYSTIDRFFFATLRRYLYEQCQHRGVSHILTYTVTGAAIWAAVWLLHGHKKMLHSLGLRAPMLQALAMALLCTTPMLVGYAAMYDLNPFITLDQVLVTVLSAAFFEELYLRGFLFGQLFSYTKWGFTSSVIGGALLFGAMHIYQSPNLWIMVGIFFVTLMGALLFSWLYVEWSNNLWVPIFLHLLMNFSWLLFKVDESALGGLWANVYRAITVAAAIGLTIWYRRRRGGLKVNSKNWWLMKGD